MLVFLGISFAGILILGSYYDQPITEALSFSIRDNTHYDSGFGAHSFGDFQEIRYALPTDEYPNHWENGANSYTPLALLPHVVAKIVENEFGVQKSLLVYLFLLALCLVAPGVYAARSSRKTHEKILLFSLLFMFAQPVIVGLDRGNSSVLAVPLLMIFAAKFEKDPNWIATISLIGATAIRPQYALLGVALLAMRQFRHLFYSSIGVFAMTFIPFLFWPGDTFANINSWLTNLRGYGWRSSTSNTFPSNLSMSTSLHITVSQYYYAITSVVVLASIIFVFCVFRTPDGRGRLLITTLSLPCLMLQVSYSYYAVFVLVIAALIIRDASFLSSRSDNFIVSSDARSFETNEIYNYLVIVVVAISLAPLPFVRDVNKNSVSLEYFSTMWTIVLIGTLVQQISQWRKSRREGESKSQAETFAG